jgi:hypothetical protein
MSKLINIVELDNFIHSIVNDFEEYNFNFKEIDDILFFVDLHNRDDLVDAINQRNEYSKELVRDLVLLERKVSKESIEHYRFVSND